MKRFVFALLAILAMATSASADQIFFGDTTGGPTFDRPSSMVANALPGRVYQVQPFYVDVTGNYNFEIDSQAASGYTHTDCFGLIYGPTWDPTASLTGLINGDDDYSGAFLYLPGSAAAGTFQASQIAVGGLGNFNALGLPLTAGTQYYAVVTGFGAGDFGTYTAAIGDGAGGGTVTLGVIPEPTSAMICGLGLLGLTLRRRK